MPVYNGEKYLKESIESILSQSFRDFEFIIINDGSTDNSYEIIQYYSQLDNRIKVINQENKGIVASLNIGIMAAQGDFIARMDADDISHNDRFKKQLDYINDNELDIIGCNYFEISESGNLISLRIVPHDKEIIDLSLCHSVPFAHPSVMFRRQFIIDNKLLYGQGEYVTAEDLSLWISMHDKKARFGNHKEILFSYRVLNSSLSRNKRKLILSDSSKLFNIFCKKNKSKLINIIDNNLQKEPDNRDAKFICASIIKLLIRHGQLKYCKKLFLFPKKMVIECFLSELNKVVKL